MKSLFIVSLILLLINSQASAIIADCTKSIPPIGSYMETCDEIHYDKGYFGYRHIPVCILSARCLTYKHHYRPYILEGPVGQFPEICKDIKNQNGYLLCVR